MNPIKITKLSVAVLFIFATNFALASFTGKSERKSSTIFSLKNFNKNFYKTASPFSLRAGFTFRGFQVLSQKKESNGDITLNSMMRFEKGNTTYIYPYKHKVSTPKFITPSQGILR